MWETETQGTQENCGCENSWHSSLTTIEEV